MLQKVQPRSFCSSWIVNEGMFTSSMIEIHLHCSLVIDIHYCFAFTLPEWHRTWHYDEGARFVRSPRLEGERHQMVRNVEWSRAIKSRAFVSILQFLFPTCIDKEVKKFSSLRITKRCFHAVINISVANAKPLEPCKQEDGIGPLLHRTRQWALGKCAGQVQHIIVIIMAAFFVDNCVAYVSLLLRAHYS